MDRAVTTDCLSIDRDNLYWTIYEYGFEQYYRDKPSFPLWPNKMQQICPMFEI